MNIQMINIKELKAYKNNPRNNKHAIESVANSIKEFGFKQPIIIDNNNEIIAGHTRLFAAKKLKLNEIPCIVASDLTDEQIKAFRLVDNKTSEIAEWDMELLNIELTDILNIDMSAFNFDFSELENEVLKGQVLKEREDLSHSINNKYEIVITCSDEFDLEEKYNKLTEEGYECRISTL